MSAASVAAPDTAGGELRATGISVVYAAGRERTVAVRDASLTVAQGETVGIVGESGSGKTTIGRAMAGFVGLTAGTITLAGRPVNSGTPGGRRTWGLPAVQMIFQDATSALDPRRPVWAAVAEAISRDGRGARSARPAALRYLADVGIGGPLADRLPRELSGGERQRVTIARALAARPSFLVCDESTSGLDVSVRGGILNLIVAARAEYHLGIVFISHDIAVVGRIADRIAVMYGGLLVEVGPTATLLSRPAHPYTQALIAASEAGHPPGGTGPVAGPEPDTGVVRAEASPASAAAGTGCPYRLTCPVALAVCGQVVPPLAGVAETHLVACHNPQERP
ncbi:MAG TPA: ABC transporter ATP-binding protein [Trebonia sp.]|nr:ABC transporter ATP-binding protein [Trebonia sp.]